MSKKILSKVVALIAAVSMCFGGMGAVAAEQKDYTPDSGIGITPYFTTIVAYSNDLTLNSGGRLTCYGSTQVQYGYIAGVSIELQQYNGGWTTIKSWPESTAFTVVTMSNDWYVAKGYSYRLKLTHRAYNTNWNVLETYISYSNIRDYV